MLLALLACATTPSDSDVQAFDDEAVAKVLELSRPDAALGLLDGMTRTVDSELCPVDVFDDGDGLREVWASCPGGAHLGSLDRYEDDGMAWLEARRIAVVHGDEAFRMDGAVEHVVDEELTTLEMAATLCGDGWGDCAEPLQVDLSWTILARDDVDEVLVSGTLMSPDLGPVELEGTWTLDAADCPSEPVRGLLQVEGARVQAFEFDGACDGCAAWSVDGEDLGAFCE